MKSVCILLCLVGAAAAQKSAENTPLQCSDHLDNDKNGFVDCDDPGCFGVGHCTPALVDLENEKRLSPKSQIAAGIVMMLAGAGVAAGSSAVFLDALNQRGESKQALELTVGGVMAAAGVAIGIVGAVVVKKGWRRYKEDVEMGLAFGPASLRVTF